MEQYRFPSNLNGISNLPKNIRPTFRDTTDLTPGFLAEEIYKALCSSEWLIIICSPRSAKSSWVCKEAQAFIDAGRADHIIPFVIEGSPFSKDPDNECYPEALLKLTGIHELLAANINEMGREAAFIKVVARMFNLRFDTLWQRHKKAETKKKYGTMLDGSICIVDCSTWSCIRVINDTPWITSMSFSNDGNYLVTSTDEGTIQIWDTHSEEELISKIRERFKMRTLTSDERKENYLE